jgi:hypothetical protein
MNAFRPTLNLILLAAVLFIGACTKPPTLHGGPIVIDAEPATYEFQDSARAGGSSWELCFEFELNEHSHHAAGITARLIAVDGTVTPLEPTSDRRGERVVCLIAPLDEPQRIYRAVELSAPRPLEVRLLRGGSY